jgi:hypothetical protein
MFESQTAHQAAAQSGNLFRIKRHALFFSHFYGNSLQILQYTRTTNHPAANGNTFCNACFLAGANLL